MKILIAPNAFKNSLAADEAAGAIQAGLEESRLLGSYDCFPIGDGGDGTGDLIIKRLGARLVECAVHDPLGRPIQASFGWVEERRLAIIEMADASGLRLLRPEELNPLRATSRGTGELIRHALAFGAKEILLGLGGSATVDGGVGLLEALGMRFLDGQGKKLTGMPESLANLQAIDHSGLDSRLARCRITVLCDVDNYLLGPEGAAAVFGPQKGATLTAIEELNQSLRQLALVAGRYSERRLETVRHGGAAGGTAAGLYGLLNAELVNGIERFLDITGFDDALADADWVITGEGSIDEQTPNGKGPYGVAVRARNKGIPVIGLAGRVPLIRDATLDDFFVALLAIGEGPSALSVAMVRTRDNLVRMGRQLGNVLAAAGRTER
jgi:glycerate kinase